jgi:hypothetical protein
LQSPREGKGKRKKGEKGKESQGNEEAEERNEAGGQRMPTDPDWIEIPNFTFAIRGMGGSSVTFVAESVLAKRIVPIGVVYYTVTVLVETPDSTCRHSLRFADYSGLRRLRDGLSAIRSGAEESVSLATDAFAMTLGFHSVGVRKGLLVQGQCSTSGDTDGAERQSCADIAVLDARPMVHTRFAFPSSLVDPPCVDTAISEMNELLRFLEEEGFHP